MSKKQKRMLVRILITFVMLAALRFIPIDGIARFGLYLIAYLIIGYDILKKAGKEMSELDKVMIAGQFGAHLPADSLIGTGILPAEVKDKLVYVGNSSKTGAYMALLSGQVKRDMEELAHHMDYMELGATEGYERLFADCLMFPEVH